MRCYKYEELFRSTGPPLLFGLRLWASSCLALYVAFCLQLDSPYWAAASAAIVCQPQLGASLRKGWFRMVGTFVGAIAVVLMAACFPQDRIAFLICLSLWGGACALAATVLRNFAAYAAALAGYTTAIIAGDQLGAVGGLHQDVFMTALIRVTEISIGIFSSGLILAGTDLGRAPIRLASLLGDLIAGIKEGFAGTLASPGAVLPDAQPLQRGFIRRVIALDPIIDQTIGESSQIRHHSPVLQQAVDGLFAALSGWQAVANHFARLSRDSGSVEAAVVLQRLPPEFVASQQGDLARWMSDPVILRSRCAAAIRSLTELPAGTPSVRLLADKTAQTLAGILHALNGMALLAANPVGRVPSDRGTASLRVPDWLPALVNAGRAFVTILAAALFWIATAWPSGATAITWTTITVTLMSAQGDQAYPSALWFTAGNLLAVCFAAVLLFAILPNLETFAGLSIAVGAYLVPIGVVMTRSWGAALSFPMVANFFAFLQPANQISYDQGSFYNSAAAIVGGCALAAIAFRIIPSLSPAFRTRRLLQLTLRDLRRLARGKGLHDWEDNIRGRLLIMPEQATPLQRAQLLAALSAGSEILQLRQITSWLRLSADLDPAVEAVAAGKCENATAHLSRLDAALAVADGVEEVRQTCLRARGSILVLSEVLTQHATYFDSGVPS
jgi:uncharacterized membrane protein YccC